VKKYEIIDVSGADVHLNSDFQQMLHEITQPSVDGIVAAAMDRITRPDSYSSFGIWDAFVQHKKLIWFPGSEINPAQDSGFIETIITGMMAGLDRRRILQNTQTAKEANRRRGRCPSAKITLPQGVDFDLKTGKWSWVEPYASRIREAFKILIAEQPSIRSLAARLGYACERTLYNQLGNPIWTGIREYKYRRGEKYPSKDGHQRDRRKILRGEPLRVKIDIQPLISEDEFARAQEIRANRKSEWISSRAQESRFESTGIIYCGRCGKRMYSRTDTRPGRHDEYYCKSRFPSGIGCGSLRIWREHLDFMIGSFVTEYFTKRAALMSLLASLNSRPSLRPVIANIEKGKAEIARLSTEKKRLLSLSVRGLFDDSQVEDESRRIESEVQSWTAFLRQAERQRETLSVSNAKSAAELLVSIFAEFEFLSVKHRKKLLRQFLAKVYVLDGAIVKLALRVPLSSTNSGIRTDRDSSPPPA
jgi:DNA invertase Pin-like site-specific DNA recombinase